MEASPTIRQHILNLVLTELHKVPWYPTFQDEPRLEIFAVRPTGDAFRADFLAGHKLYCYAQSGSDWGSYTILRGWALFRNEQLLQHHLEVILKEDLTEYNYDEYRHEEQFEHHLEQARTAPEPP